MATHIAALGVLKYETKLGSVTFPGDVTTQISSKAVKTKDGRAIKYVEYTLNVSGWLFSSDLSNATNTVDGAFAATKLILNQPGGKLTITGKGFGDIYVNRDSSGAGRDLKFGPFPETISWKPHGNITCEFTWQVTFTLPWNPNGSIPGILDYNWTTSYRYDSAGFCDRTISGELEIAGTRVNQNTEVAQYSNIEAQYRQQIKVTCPYGFHRTSHDITVDESKTKVTFSFVDEQDRGLTMPPGICDMDIQHEMTAQSNKMTIGNWFWVFSCTAVPEAKFPTSYAYRACLDAFQSRFQYMIRRLVSTRTGNIIPLPVSIRVSERVKQRSATLSVVFSVTAAGGGKNGTFMPQDILARSGMWQPFPWTPEQHKAVADAPLGPNNTGGYTQMMTDLRQNVVISISELSPYIPDPGRTTGNIKLQKPPNEDDLVVQPFGAYIEFKVWLAAKTQGNRWVNYPLSSDPNIANKAINFGEVQKVFHPYNEYALIGYILRCGMPPAGIPSLATIGGKKVEVPAGSEQRVITKPIYNTLGMNIWRTDFYIPYVPVAVDTGNPVKATQEGNGSRNQPQQVQSSVRIGVREEAVVNNPAGDELTVNER